MKTLAIIPARGGSKRIPGKNIRDFLGKPMIQYSIDAALESKCFTKVMVSTDDKKIAQVAKHVGAEVPFMRSAKNAHDKSILVEVVLEVLAQYQESGQVFDLVCVILPTAPLLKIQSLKKGLALLKKPNIQAAMPVVSYGHPIQRAFRIKSGQLRMFDPKFMHKNSQDLEPSYHDAGQFYWLKVAPLLRQKKLFLDKLAPIILPESGVQDIDVEEDLKIAKLKYKLLNNLS